MDPLRGDWSGIGVMHRKQFTCGYCGRDNGSKEGIAMNNSSLRPVPTIYMCGSCNRPVFFDTASDGTVAQRPEASFGSLVRHLPPSVDALWRECREAVRVGAYSAAGMVARSLMMHVAVEKGADPGERFVHYVRWLADNHHVPVGARGWVDRIRTIGNEATHDLVVLTQEQAHETLTFTEALLRMTYELPGSLPQAPTT